MNRMLMLIVPVLLWACSAMAAEQGVVSPATLFKLEFIRAHCIPFSTVVIGGNAEADASDCSVTEFGHFFTLGDSHYYYVLYCLIPGYNHTEKCSSHGDDSGMYSRRALALFLQQGSSEDVSLYREIASAEVSLTTFERPQIINNRYGTILYIPIALDGTGHGNLSEYYLLENREWKRLESNAWQVELAKKGYQGMELRIEWPDLKGMTAKGWLYRKGDANCCPSGGTVEAVLGIKNNALVVESMRVLYQKGTK